VATLYGESASAPVHVRNMSPSGALIESAVLPEPGSRIALMRGNLRAAGRIAWRSGGRAGIAFDATVYVADWMSRKVGAHQAKVDEMISAVRAGASVATSQDEQATDTIEPELILLRADLAELGNSLVNDTILVATHPEIQVLDISIQRIDRMLLRLHQGMTSLGAG
jgi:hypothetical protein